jgi:hypothetical protein
VGDGDPAAELVEAFRGAFGVDERPVAQVRVRKQKTSGVCVRARDENRGHAANVGRKTRGNEFFDELARGHDDFATWLATLLCGRELVFEMNACGAGFDHRFHQFVGVQRLQTRPRRRLRSARTNSAGLLAFGDSIWSARCNARLMRFTRFGAESQG